MAPKRSAQPTPPPPPPPAPAAVESSMETESGSDSDEEEIAHSPPTAVSKKNMAPPPQNVQQPESSDEEEEDEGAEEDDDEEGDDEEEEEEEEEQAPPLPQKVQQPESSDEEDEDEEEEEEEATKANYTAPAPATTNPPPPNREESESDEDEEDETDDEAPPQPESVPKQDDVVNGRKPLPSSEDKKPAAPFKRVWSKDDEVRILQTLAAHRREHGTLPQPEVLEAALVGSLENTDYGRKELMVKVTSLKSVYSKALKRAAPRTNDQDRLIFDLSKEIWGGRGSNKPAGGAVPSDFGEMCKMYPYLGDELQELERAQPGLYKRRFSLLGNEVAGTLDDKIKKQRIREMKVDMRGMALDKEVMKTLTDLVQ